MNGKNFLFILILLFVELNSADGLLDIPIVDLKPVVKNVVNPVVKTATNLVNDIAKFTINEILNFKSFKSLFSKIYDTLELENIALLNFLINQRDVDEHNAKYEVGQVSYRRAVCEYSDMSTDDMNKYVNKFHMPIMKRNRRKKKVKIVNEEMAGNEVEEVEVEGYNDVEEAEEYGGVVGPILNLFGGLKTKKTQKDAERVVPVLKEDKSTVGTKNRLKVDRTRPKKQPVDEDTDPATESGVAYIYPDETSYQEDYTAPEDNLDYLDDYQSPNLPVANDLIKYLSIHTPSDLLNYVTDGFNTKVLNQGLCGSCWSFSAAAAIEAAWFIKTGEIVKLSEQQLIDCNRNKDNEGCEGGNMANAFTYVQNNGGISLSSRYPYKGNDTYRCKFVSPDVEVIDHQLLDPGDEDLLLEMLIKHGPIAVAIDASLKSFQTYKSGVYYDPKCTDKVNHAMLLVGYGTDKATNEDYWILKNTYGKTWGINGYMWLARNQDNHCGITEFATFPIC